MAGYKEPGLEARRGAAADARAKALEKLKTKTPVDPAVQAEKIAKAQAREQALQDKRAAALAQREQERIDKAEAAAAAAAAAIVEQPTEAELKAARDARYAARKARRK